MQAFFFFSVIQYVSALPPDLTFYFIIINLNTILQNDSLSCCNMINWNFRLSFRDSSLFVPFPLSPRHTCILT